MWAAFKLLTWQAKAGIIGLALAILLVVIGSTAYVSYQKGLNVSKVEIQKYETKSQQLQAKLNKAQGKVDVQVVTQYKDRVQYVDRVVYQTRDVIRTSVVPQFKLSKGWIYAYNQSVQGLAVDPTLAADSSAASVSDVDALADTIAPNNGVCLANKAQLDSLQQWVRETEMIRHEVTK